MSLNIEKLENVKHKGSRISARCPACAEQGKDNKGEHLSIDDQGRFSCVMYPGEVGADHRKRIFAMIGIKDANGKSYSSQQNKVIKVKKVNRNTGNVIKSNILGSLGRVNQTLKKHNEIDNKERIYNKDFEKGVPSIPTIENGSKRKPDEALRLESEKRAYKIHSRILGDDLWIVATEKELQGLANEGIAGTIYTLEEVSRMIDEGVSKEGLIKIHSIKKFFPGATVEDIESEQKKN